MKSKLKKILTLSIVVIMLGSFTVGCSSGREEQINDTEYVTEEPQNTNEGTNMNEDIALETEDEPSETAEGVNIKEDGKYNAAMTSLKFEYPKDLKVISDKDNITSISNDDNSVALTVGIFPLNGESLDDFIGDTTSSLLEKFPDSDPKQEDIKVGDTDVIKISYGFEVSEEMIYESLYFWEDDNNNLIIISYASKDENPEDLEKIIDSIEI